MMDVLVLMTDEYLPLTVIDRMSNKSTLMNMTQFKYTVTLIFLMTKS